jgi:Zn-dependent protease with chaperone function
MNSLSPHEWNGLFFDGTSSLSHSVTVTRSDDGTLHIQQEGQQARSVPANRYSVAPPVGRTPLRLKLSDGGMIQIPWSEELLITFKEQISTRNQILERIERRPGLCLSVVTLAGLMLTCGYIYGVPVITNFLAPQIPTKIKTEIGSHAMSILDKLMFEPSGLSDEKRKRVSEVVHRLREADHYPHPIDSTTRNMVVKGKSLPNALALLPSTIIATDKLVDLLQEPELEAVLAHELGHLHYDHSTKTLVRVSFVSLMAVMLFGGDPGVFQSLALNLVDAKNSRTQEHQADDFAVNLLKSMNHDPMALHAALTKISEGHPESESDGFLSSHPVTSERLRFIKEFSGR